MGTTVKHILKDHTNTLGMEAKKMFEDEGMSIASIADQMNLSVETIHTCLRNLNKNVDENQTNHKETIKEDAQETVANNKVSTIKVD